MQLVERARAEQRQDEDGSVSGLRAEKLVRLPRTAAFLSAAPMGIPLSFSHHLRHNRALQGRGLLVSVVTKEIPFVALEERSTVTMLADGFERVILNYGFMEPLHIPSGIAAAQTCIPSEDLGDVSYYIGHETVITSPRVKGMAPAGAALHLHAAKQDPEWQLVLHSVLPGRGGRPGDRDLAVTHRRAGWS